MTDSGPPTDLGTIYVVGQVALLLILGAMSLPTAARAQEAGSLERVEGLPAVAGFSIRDSQTGVIESIDVFIKPRRDLRLPDGAPWIDFAAQRQVTSAAGGEETTWASSEDCPALRNTLIWLTTLVAPRIEIPGITASEASHEGRRPRSVTEDGFQITVWGRGTQPDHIANTRVEISSNGGLVAEFGRAAQANLAACWRSAH